MNKSARTGLPVHSRFYSRRTNIRPFSFLGTVRATTPHIHKAAAPGAGATPRCLDSKVPSAAIYFSVVRFLRTTAHGARRASGWRYTSRTPRRARPCGHGCASRAAPKTSQKVPVDRTPTTALRSFRTGNRRWAPPSARPAATRPKNNRGKIKPAKSNTCHDATICHDVFFRERGRITPSRSTDATFLPVPPI